METTISAPAGQEEAIASGIAATLQVILHEKGIKLKLSGDEVYHTNTSALLVMNMLCSKLLCQKVFNSIPYKIASGLAATLQVTSVSYPTGPNPIKIIRWSGLAPDVRKSTPYRERARHLQKWPIHGTGVPRPLENTHLTRSPIGPA